MKSSSTIDLMKTPNGYSLIENDNLINKSLIPNVSQQNVSITTAKYNSKDKLTAAIPKKFITQQNFTIYPYIYGKDNENQRYVVIPARSQWFNLNSIHELEKKALPEWFKQKKGVLATINHIKFEKNQELYKKYRNHIIQLGKNKYVSPLIARKGLAGDACSIIRIHNCLQKWGLINYVYKKPDHSKKLSSENNQQHLLGVQENTSVRKKDCFDKDKSCISKNYDKDDLELLKKITKKFRPSCSSCQGICGVSWYQFKEQIQLKKFSHEEQTNTVSVHSGQYFDYCIRVCFGCFCQKNYPVVLGIDDFTRRSIVELVKFIDFDKKYNKKKFQQLTRISQTLQKNKFNISKSSQFLKLSQNQLFDSLLQMPIQTLQKISRIEPQTQDQIQRHVQNVNNLNKDKQNLKNKQTNIGLGEEDDEDLRMFQTNLKGLQLQQKKVYEEFIQSWLLKIYAKMQQLEQWDNSIQWKLLQNQSSIKYNLAERIKKNFIVQNTL